MNARGHVSSRKQSSSAPHKALSDAGVVAQFNALVGYRRGLVAALVVVSVLAGLTESGILAIIAQAAAAVVAHSRTINTTLGPVSITAGLGVLLVVGLALVAGRTVLQIFATVLPSQIATDMQARIRRDVFNAFTAASWDEQSRDREGLLQELLTNQVWQVTFSGIVAATTVVIAVTFAILVISAVVLSPIAAVIVGVTSIGLFAVLRPVSRIGQRLAGALSRTSIDYAEGVNESVRLAEEIHVFGGQRAQLERSEGLIGRMRLPFFRMQVLSRGTPAIYQSVVYLLVIAALLIIYEAGYRGASNLGAVILLLVRAGMYGQQMQAGYSNVLLGLPFLDRMREAERRYAAGVRTDGHRRLTDVETIRFENVSFAYPSSGRGVSAVDFEVAAGDAIGVVGPTGAGKSTFVQLLLGLRVPDSGKYLVNEVSALEFRRSDWHEHVAYVPQEPRLMHASVAENIRFWRELDDAAVERAARLAGIHDEIVTWTNGYDTLIGPRADAISGGQRQRICLARALAGEPQLLVLDEPTSALDPSSERLIHESLTGVKGQVTLFVVAHRLSTLDVCDRIMAIVDGRLEAFGPIADMRASSSYYRSVTAPRTGSDTLPVGRQLWTSET